MEKLRVLDLFSGIGGFSLGLERTGGFETVAFCEIEEFPRKVLAKHWPEVPCYRDVRELTAERLTADGIADIDVITGGFPCQDISTAGRQAGIADGTRSGLWSEIVRLARDLRPKFILVENVANLLAGPSDRPGAWFGRVLGDLACIGYDAEWENIPASALGAPHRRERIWLTAYPAQNGNQEQRWAFDGTNETEPQGSGVFDIVHAMAGNRDAAELRILARPDAGVRKEVGRGWLSQPNVCRMDDGLPDGPHRLGALGNAVVPQIPELIGNAILAAINSNSSASHAGRGAAPDLSPLAAPQLITGDE